jgi:hypothetical protein
MTNSYYYHVQVGDLANNQFVYDTGATPLTALGQVREQINNALAQYYPGAALLTSDHYVNKVINGSHPFCSNIRVIKMNKQSGQYVSVTPTTPQNQGFIDRLNRVETQVQIHHEGMTAYGNEINRLAAGMARLELKVEELEKQKVEGEKAISELKAQLKFLEKQNDLIFDAARTTQRRPVTVR